jgi:hypothetical protein
MFAAYFDESGTSKDPHALTVAGAVSSVNKWLRLETQWNAILRKHGVKVFHMSECAHGKGEFKGWTGDQRRGFISELSECTARHVKRGISVTIILSDWRRMDADYMITERQISPYVYASRLCIGSARRWNLKHGGAPIEYIFEDGAEDKGKLFNAMSYQNVILPIFKPKSLPQLQVADLFAWKTRRIIHDMVKQPFTMTHEQYEDSFAEIRSIPGDYSVVEEERLRYACRTLNIPKRS